MLSNHTLSELLPAMSPSEYDQLKASIRTSGYNTLFPVITYEGQILDGRHRYQACIDLGIEPAMSDYAGSDPLAFIISHNLQRRHLTAGQKAIVGMKIKELFAERANERMVAGKALDDPSEDFPQGRALDQAGAVVGVSGRYIHEAENLMVTAPELFDQVKAGQISLNEAAVAAKSAAKQAKREELANRPATPTEARLIHGDFRTADIAPESVDCIITDPPYPREFIDLWADLSAFGERVLKPGGFLVAYSGELNLPDVIERLGHHMTYYWTFCLYHDGQTQLVHPRNVICRWKPVLVYQKPPFKKLDHVVQDYVISRQPEKDGHEWQQSESGVAELIERFTEPGQVVCDPFMGAGTFPKVATSLGRTAIGVEVDETTYKIAASRQ